MKINAHIVGLQQARTELSALAGRLSDLGPFYLRAGLVPLRAAQARIDAGGPGWPPAKIEPRNSAGQTFGTLLHRTGALYRSLTLGDTNNVREDIAGGIRVGTGLRTPDGAYNIGYLQQYGTKRGIPPRKFLFIDDETAQAIREIGVRYVKGDV